MGQFYNPKSMNGFPISNDVCRNGVKYVKKK